MDLTSESVPVLSAEEEAELRADVVENIERGRNAQLDWSNAAMAELFATLDAERNRLGRALVEAVLPLEVIAAQHRAKPYRELSADFIEDTIGGAIAIVRAAIEEAHTDDWRRYVKHDPAGCDDCHRIVYGSEAHRG